MKRTLYLLALLFAFAFNLSAQTIGGHTVDKTWTWMAVDDTVGISATTLFTPTETGDYLITAYLSINPTGDNAACPVPVLTFTDEFGTKQLYLTQLATSVLYYGGANYVVNFGAGVSAIHVIASTTVSVAVSDQHECSSTPSGSYNFVVSKTKLNP